MIQQLRIQNFKSLRDVTLDLQRVNLLIGPNNCGKTNVLKALKFFSDLSARNYSDVTPEKMQTLAFIGQSGEADRFLPLGVQIYVHPVDGDLKLFGALSLYTLQIGSANEPAVLCAVGVAHDKVEISLDIDELDRKYDIFEWYLTRGLKQFEKYKSLQQYCDYEDPDVLLLKQRDDRPIYYLQKYGEDRYGSRSKIDSVGFEESVIIVQFLRYIHIYKPDPTTLLGPYPVVSEERVAEDASNLVAFLQVMRNKYHDVYRRIEEDLQRFVPEFTAISFDIVDVEKSDPIRLQYPDKSFAKLGLLDRNKRTFWAEDLSEGILYFLALLAIIHQPDPPKLLLLEEPEKGIHPRRIREVLDLIFELAEEKDVQVIMTTHSPLVVDYFSDTPESVFILEKPENETIVKNLQRDIIEPMDKKFRDAGEEPIPYTEALGEHWAMGFLGGVPYEQP